MAGSEVPSWWQLLLPQDRNVTKSTEYDLKKYLLLLATLVATVTYAAGLNLPGGSWQEDTPGGQVAGDSILRDTNYRRYIVFYCFNAISFAASLVVGLLLLVLRKGTAVYLLLVLQTVMVLDLLCLVGAYAAGSSHDSFTTLCGIAVLVSAVSAYATVVFLSVVLVRIRPTLRRVSTVGRDDEADKLKAKKALAGSEREILLVLAIFAATIAYVAGLNPPGGFWRSTEEGHHTAGDPVLQALHPRRYRFFFVCNTTAFIASLLAIMLIVDRKKFRLNIKGSTRVPYVALYVCILTALLGLGAAYAAGSCRDSKHTIYVLCLVAPVVACIFVPKILIDKDNITDRNESNLNITNDNQRDDENGHNDLLDKTRECVQLLAALAATIAYQAGVDPPGGVWSEKGAGHSVGDPILLTTHHGRFEVFFYFNSAAFVASLVIMAMLQKESLLRLHVLEKAIILDLFALVGAYATGSCRDTSTSIYTVAMAGAVLIYVVIHIVFFTTAEHSGNGNGNGNRNRNGKGGHQELDEYREVLLLLAILAATLTYQAGLTPPGGFWEKDDDRSGHRAGFPVLQDKYPRRYKAFFYCNAASFMASVALILLLLNANLYRPGIRCYALYVCMVAGMFGLMAAYAAGSSLHLRTSIISLALVIAVFAALVCLAIGLYHVSNKRYSDGDDEPTAQGEDEEEERKAMAMAKAKAKKDNMMLEYLMLVGILGASVTYLTGLKPPGGLWREDGDGHSAGNPVLYDISKPRYNAFFYSNSTSFMASIVVMALLLRRMMLQWPDVHGRLRRMPLWPMHTAMFLGMVALLVAYAAGSARDACTSWKVIVLLVPIVGFVMCLFAFNKKKQEVQAQTIQILHMSARPDVACLELGSQVGGDL
ncbi:unnamed protein product [Miscanthus lutarioriparius]|uniref:PGG domain-containing protein n=1 Tax=Miscanthus lutarioriparius TaxID=422564 RepID=A0A811QA64_9POAL|nr:unnamed protein product [Miscanthus lutarioriparius]